ncbi:hypothetical protein BGZ51_004976 [Haplosporangium sp. Z 767]|nr:hypothetical protein BGZ50_000216 [Haplosporangium sp. Z 11]KAF9182102.1 hypothetical protein BGZ51_004976 [Haplosporangium sp. Z 767]
MSNNHYYNNNQNHHYRPFDDEDDDDINDMDLSYQHNDHNDQDRDLFHYPSVESHYSANSTATSGIDGPSNSSNNSGSNINNNAGEPNINSNTNANNGAETKTRKKPGRKPGPTCPALRKEQNRAAQRAFRDRKERHLHQLENMIKDLKNQHFLVTSQLQREAHQLKSVIESFQSENYYLREVVFAFESALSKGNHIDILQDVKQELFRRHYENRAAANIDKQTSQATLQELPATPGTPATPATPGVSATSPGAATASPSLSPAAVSATAAPTTPRSPLGVMSPTAAASATPETTTTPISSTITDNMDNNNKSNDDSNSNINRHGSRADPAKNHDIRNYPTDEGIYSMDGDILYKAPPLFIPELSSDGKLAPPTSPFGPLSVPRPAYCPPGTNLPPHTDYTKHPTVFDELQSSLFPPGTLESLRISMATPQEVVSDDSLFAEPMTTENGTGGMSMDDDSDEDDKNELADRVAASIGLKLNTFPRHRLHKEIRVLMTAKPQTDPKIDPKVYELPHDLRIDFIPCPKLRAQMIVHQHRYNADEVFQLLLDEAICHGPPLNKASWQLPEAFFDRFGFLLGLELERIRNKSWPPKH